MINENKFDERDDYGNYLSNLEFLNHISGFSKRWKILEIGSGKGRILSNLNEEGYDIVGIELQKKFIDRSVELYGELPVFRMSGDDMSFEDSTFDCVISFDVFEHIPDTDRHIREVYRVLKPYGCYLLQTPNKWTNSVFETLRWRSFTKWRNDHCSLHNYWQIKRVFEMHNFETEFYNIPIVTDFFKFKIKSYLGNFGLLLLQLINPDKFPMPLKTNFYIKSKKIA